MWHWNGTTFNNQVRVGCFEKREKDYFTNFPHDNNVHGLRRKFKENLSLSYASSVR